VSFPLEQIQRWMQTVLMHPGGVAEGMQSESARQHIALAPGEIDQVVSRSAALDEVERLEIYARAYYARLVECMEAEFPILARAVGEELFREFAVGYLECYPSRSYTLNHLGGRFAEYLAETIPTDEKDSAGDAGSTSPAFLVDLARLEWTFNEVFDGPGVENSVLLQPEQLARIEPEAWADVRLVPAPCLRVLQLSYPVHEYYRALRADSEAVPPRQAETWLAVTRRDYVVRHYPLVPTQYALLQAVLSGATVGEAIERAVAVGDLEPQRLAGQLREWFRFWSAEGFFLSAE
jgi:hypothetical protein